MVSSPPLLLLPGMLTTPEIWNPVLAHLSVSGEVIVADFEPFDDLGAMADYALALIERVSGPVAVAGFSMGGFVAYEMLARAPARIGRLALLDTSVRTETPSQAEHRERLMARAQADYEGVIVAGSDVNLHPEHRSRRDLLEPLEAMARQFGWDGFERQSRALMRRQDFRELLSELAIPVAVVCGTHDTMTPPRLAEELVALIPQARLALIPQAAHMTLTEQPAQVAAVLQEWLA